MCQMAEQIPIGIPCKIGDKIWGQKKEIWSVANVRGFHITPAQMECQNNGWSENGGHTDLRQDAKDA